MWQDSTSVTLHWLPPANLPSAPTTGYRVEIRRLATVSWESRPLPPFAIPDKERRPWQQYPIVSTLEEGAIRRVRNCAVLELSGLQTRGADGLPLSYANTVLYINHEVRRIVTAAVNQSEGLLPPGLLPPGAELDAGATLVQLYSGLIYRGPFFAAKLAWALADRQRT